MKHFTRLPLVSAILLTLVSLLTVRPMFPPIAAQNGDEELRQVYQDPELFEQLSAAAQTLLENRFGSRNGKVKTPEEAQVASSSSTPEILSAPSNPLVNDPAADTTSRNTQSTTTIVLGSGSNLIAGFNDSGSRVGGANKFTGFSRSADGGETWADMGTLPTNPGGDSGDPVLVRDTVSGRIYFATLRFSGTGIQVFRSDTDGETFLAPVNGTPGKTGLQDKPWLAVDNFAGPGQGNVYLVERDFGPGNGIYFFRSIDGGDTWEPDAGRLIASRGAFSVQGAWVTVGPDHAVYVFWLDQSAGSGTPNIIKMRKSTDQGSSFDAPVTVATLRTTGVNGSLGSVGGFRTNSYPQALVNPTDANSLYLVYNDIAAAPSADRGNIFFKQSNDGGTTWEEAVQLNTDEGTNLQWSPAIGIKPDGSGLAVTWYDRRNSPNDRIIEFWGVAATISGTAVSFGPNFRTSPQFPAVFGRDPFVNSVYMGDYNQIVADNSFFYATWGDNRLGNPDVRFVKFPMEGPGPVLDFASSVLSGGDGDGLIDLNECNRLEVTVRNNGSTPTTGVTAVLSTSTPGVTITQPNTTYPDINPGATGANPLPFQISTSPDFVCGTDVELTLTLSYTNGSDVVSLTQRSGELVGDNYTITSSTDAPIVPGETDIGNHCDDCTTTIPLPFAYTLYDQTYSSVNVSSNGNLQFVSNNSEYTNICLPAPSFNFAIFAHWDDLLTDFSPGAGIFTSVSGSAPDRIFNIEWRTFYFSGPQGTANFEIRLYEGQRRFDIIYGTVSQAGMSATVGVQKGTGTGGLFTQYRCNMGGLSPGLQLTFGFPPLCNDGGGECTVKTATKHAAPDRDATGSKQPAR